MQARLELWSLESQVSVLSTAPLISLEPSEELSVCVGVCICVCVCVVTAINWEENIPLCVLSHSPL